IFKEIVRAEDRSFNEAESQHGTDLKKVGKLQERLVEYYKGELADKYGLTREQLKSISLEGLQKQWPMP
ncbi:MAG: hypothetical protein ACE5H0_15345, partial [Bacteroidota bacterium]